MRSTTPLLVLLLALSACRREPDCGSDLVYDRGTRACACPAGMAFDLETSRCVVHADGGVDLADAAPDSGTARPITVTALRGEVPQAGLDVVFHDDAGEVVGTATTSADGSAVSPTGSTGVTILDRRTDAVSLHSVLGVPGGETITFDLPLPEPDPRPIAVSLPGPFPDAGEYWVQSPCFEDRGADPAHVFGACAYVGHDADVVAIATSADGFLAYSWVAAASSATAVTLGDWQVPLDVPFDVQWADATDGNLAAYSLPIGFGSSAAVSTYSEKLGVFRTVDGLPVIIHATGTRSGAAAESRVSFARVYYPAMIGTEAFVADLASVPQIETFAADRSDPERPELSWTGEILGAGTEAVAFFVYARSDVYIDWSIHAAPTSRSVRMPRLPDEHAALRVTPEVPSYELSWTDGGAGVSWAAARAHPLTHWSDRTSEMRSASVRGAF